MRVNLSGSVVSDDYHWLYDFFGIPHISPQIVRQAVADNPDGEDLVFEINSPGGSVFAGFEMYSILRGAKCNTVAEVQSIAASAASTLTSGCKTVLMSPVAQIMVHLPSTYTEGDRNAHQRSLGVLGSITESIINGYELKCKGKSTRAQLTALVESESWLTAQDAVDAGLADGILGVEGEEGLSPARIINAASTGIRALAAGGTIPDPAVLLAEYQRLVDEGKAPPQRGAVPDTVAPTAATMRDDWRISARIQLARARFIKTTIC